MEDYLDLDSSEETTCCAWGFAEWLLHWPRELIVSLGNGPDKTDQLRRAGILHLDPLNFFDGDLSDADNTKEVSLCLICWSYAFQSIAVVEWLSSRVQVCWKSFWFLEEFSVVAWQRWESCFSLVFYFNFIVIIIIWSWINLSASDYPILVIKLC